MVRSFNFDILQEEIKTQYNDMRGIAAIDGHEPTYLHQLCTDNGIDPDKYFLVGLEFYDGETIGRHPLVVYAYLIEKEEGDDVSNRFVKRLANTPKITIKKKSFSITYEDLGRYIKRLNIGVLSDLSEYIQDAEFVDEYE